MQQRRDEILAKKAKLAELKRQRELRTQASTSRASIGPSDVSCFAHFPESYLEYCELTVCLS